MDTSVEAARTGAEDPTSLSLRLPDGRRLSYAEFGRREGLPVLAIHGTPGSRYMFGLADAAARERGLRIIAPDRPGYGHSDYRRNSSLVRSAEDFVALADKLKIERFAVIGVSGGGPHAIATASIIPDRVALLALVSPVGPVAECRKQVRMSRMHRLIFTRMGRSQPACATFFWSLRNVVKWSPGLAYRVLQKRVAPSDRALLSRAEVKANLQQAIREGLRPGIRGALQDLRLFCSPWGLALSDIEVPSVVWQGSDDTIVPPNASYHLAAQLPYCRLDVIQEAGHYWGFGNFARVLDTVSAALRG
ncbi:alpha/beta hydrolase [Methyloceanibacter sp.]|uniref:alpha/beta fold hydrolase n=1 Tax=Methyloceanibacter sp. TaxID=1965321 RepID=UPI002D33753F|nr:alpha/beta hydrolase [Methyloceanibacter sp.]HZP10406.1 alpha/beta hydrolase [Methyloceanibacter sp.]